VFGGSFSPTTRLTYLGARAGADWRFGGHVRFVTGVWAVLRSDLSTEHVVATTTRFRVFGPSTTEVHDFGNIGGTSFLLLLRIGIEIGFGGG
jgi:hypothetical protein